MTCCGQLSALPGSTKLVPCGTVVNGRTFLCSNCHIAESISSAFQRYVSPKERERRNSARAAAAKARKKKPFRPSAWSHGPRAMSAHAAGGKLLSVPFPSRAKFDAELKAHAPGCASPIYPYGKEAGAVKCGARLDGQQVFCPWCKPAKTAESVVRNMLDT